PEPSSDPSSLSPESSEPPSPVSPEVFEDDGWFCAPHVESPSSPHDARPPAATRSAAVIMSRIRMGDSPRSTGVAAAGSALLGGARRAASHRSNRAMNHPSNHPVNPPMPRR